MFVSRRSHQPCTRRRNDLLLGGVDSYIIVSKDMVSCQNIDVELFDHWCNELERHTSSGDAAVDVSNNVHWRHNVGLSSDLGRWRDR